MNGTVGGQVSRYVSRAVIFTGAEMYYVLDRLFVLCSLGVQTENKIV